MIRILIIDNVRLICEVMAAALEDEDDIEIVGLATTLEEAETPLANAKLDLVLISTNLPDGGSLELTGNIRQDFPDTKVVVLGMADTEIVIMTYIEAGASGYVLKDASVDRLLLNIRAAYNGEALVSPQVAAALMERVAVLTQHLTELGVDPSGYEELTAREKEVLDLIAVGYSNQEIANTLTVEIGTVKNHVHSILDKLNVNSRKDAATYLTLVDVAR
ncbi:MAG: response regulator transcription factor [Chloroflexota bacterium]